MKKWSSKAHQTETAGEDGGETLKAQMEAAQSAGRVAEIAFEHNDQMTTEEIAEALYIAARKVPQWQQEVFAEGPLLVPLLGLLTDRVVDLQSARSLSQLVWSLGKFRQRQHRTSQLPEYGIEECVIHVCNMFPDIYEDCSHLDLTNTLWGLARLYPDAGNHRASGTELAVATAFHALVSRCVDKVPMLTPQCLANSFWAMGRLKVRGQDVDRFVDRALKSLAGAAPLATNFTSQGLANVLWGLAQLRTIGVGRDVQDRTVRRAVVALVEASEACLHNFQPQELSMAAWSLAKLYAGSKATVKEDYGGQSRRGRSHTRPPQVDSMLLSLAEVATECVHLFEDQGISNITWAMAILDLTGKEPAMAPVRAFFEAVIKFSTKELWNYSAQAIANLLWACVRVEFPATNKRARDKATERMSALCSAVASVMTARMNEGRSVTWRDLSGVATALQHGKHQTEAVMVYMSLLTVRAAEQVAIGELSAQQMLNIALADARLFVDPFIMQALVDNIERRILDGAVVLNDVDLRQWEEVKRWCMPCCQAIEVMDSFNAQYGGLAIPLLAPDGNGGMYSVPMFLPDEGFVGEQDMYEGFDMTEEYTTEYVQDGQDGGEGYEDPAEAVLELMRENAATAEHIQDDSYDGCEVDGELVDDRAPQGRHELEKPLAISYQ